MKIFLIYIAVLSLLYNCTNNSPINTKNLEKNSKDSLSLVIDSIRLANMHRNFVGVHNHGLSTGSKDLAEHAHQNPAKKRRWRKKQFSGIKAKKEAMQRINREKALMRGDSTLYQN